MGQYDDDIQAAYDSLLEAGGLVVCYRLDESYNPVAPSANLVRTVALQQSLAAVQFPANTSKVGKFDKSTSDGVKQTSMRYFMVAAKGATFAPLPGDVFISLSNEAMTLLGVNTLEPNGTAIYFEALAMLGAQQFTLSFLTIEFIGTDGSDGYLTTEDGNPLLLD